MKDVKLDQVAPFHQVDSASLHSLISALVRREPPVWTPWERLAVAEVTLSLLFRSHVYIPAPPKRRQYHAGVFLVDHILEILNEFVADVPYKPKLRSNALEHTKLWVDRDPENLRVAYRRFKDDPSAEVFTRWAISRDWVYHFRRFGTLVDDPTFDEVAKVLRWSSKERKVVRRMSKEQKLIELWSELCREKREFPPQEVLDGFLVSALLRGRYYQDLAAGAGGDYVWHSFRNYVMEPITPLTDFESFRDRLVELYLAGIVCRGAMEEESDQDVIISWADNVRKLRRRTLVIPRESEPERAKNLAVNIAKDCELHIRWERLERILEGTVHSFVTLVGIAAGTLTYLGTASHLVSVAAHIETERLVRPYAENLVETIKEAATGSTVYLSRLAETGMQRVFAVTTADLRLPNRQA